jgi:hypothetical protein
VVFLWLVLACKYMSKEILNEEVMQQFVAGFANEGWKITGGSSFCLYSKDGNNMFTFEDLGEESKGDSTEIVLWNGNEAYVLQEEITENGVEHFFIVPPYKERYFNPRDSWCGVIYGPDGKMEKNRNVAGLPKRIDMDKTVELFLKQVAEKDFSVPVLVKVG